MGLPVSTQTLEFKLLSSEATRQRLEAQCLYLQSKLNQQIVSTKTATAEAKLSAQGLKKVIKKNEQLREENSGLVEQCKKMKAVAKRGKSAVNRAKEAEVRVRELEDEVKGLTEDLNFFKDQYRMQKFYFTSMEEVLVESALGDLIGETESSVGEFLLTNIGQESKASTFVAQVMLLLDQIGYLVEDEETEKHAGEKGKATINFDFYKHFLILIVIIIVLFWKVILGL